MGGGLGKEDLVLQQEKETWISHAIQLEEKLRLEQLELLEHFRDKKVVKGSRKVSFLGLEYWHFFITDNEWTLEFGFGENLSDAAVNVHSNPLPKPYEVVSKFAVTEEIFMRMRRVCGARGYSLCFRNCEHLANYIETGSWISLQMAGDGKLASRFMPSLTREQQRVSNCLPRELQPPPVLPEDQAVVYAGLVPALEFKRKLDHMGAAQEKDINILVLGPTGSGKSHLINILHNKKVCFSSGGGESATKHMSITTSERKIDNQLRTVNVIDTIGFCDTEIKSAELLSIIQHWITTNMLSIDLVIFVCSGRILHVHAEAMKAMKNWLRYKDNQINFRFVYTHADDDDEAVRERSLAVMASSLGIDTDIQHVMRTGPRKGERIPLLLTVGFRPKAPYEEIRRDYERLLIAISYFDGARRLRVHKSWCNIL